MSEWVGPEASQWEGWRLCLGTEVQAVVMGWERLGFQPVKINFLEQSSCLLEGAHSLDGIV